MWPRPCDRLQFCSLPRDLWLGWAVLLILSLCSNPANAQQSSRPLFGISLRNAFLERRFSRTRTEEEPVSKSLLGSSVTGTQTTVTKTRLRIVPDPESLKFELLNTGDVTSQTTGFNPQATVDSLGKHHFEVTKPLWFDGSVFLTLPAYGSVQAFQTPQRVFSTAGANMPLLGPLTDNIAWNQVRRRGPEINQVVAEDVSRDVLPRIDRITDADIAKLQRDWQTLQKSIDTAFSGRTLKWAARSGQRSIAVWAHEGQGDAFQSSESQVSESRLLPAVPREAVSSSEEEAAAFFVSEEAVALLVSKYFPRGLKLTDAQLQSLAMPVGDLEQGGASWSTLQNLLGRIGRLRPAEAQLFTLEFSPDRPLEVRFADGDVRLLATFQIHPKLGASSGWMTTTFNLRGKRLSSDKWTLAVRSVDVGEIPADTPSSLTEADVALEIPLIIPAKAEVEDKNVTTPEDVTTVQAGTVWMPIVRNAAESLAEKIPPVRLPIQFDGSDFVPGAPEFRLGKIDSANGMLRVGLRAVEGVPATAAAPIR